MSMEDASDAALARRASAGSEAAFGALVDRYYADCLRYATRMLGRRADAEEAVQDTFVRAYRALARYDEHDRFRSWLLRILVNRCRTAGARRLREREGLERYRTDLGTLGEEGRGPEREGAEWREEVERALARLPAAQREAFLLKHVEELSYDEIAALTGDGVSALKMRVSRAAERLRQMLTEVHHG
jgi:RNA polymerase sigma-70 factor (ECF subfamily)